MGDVVVLDGPTKLPIPIQRILDGAKDLEIVLVLGWDKDGSLYAAASQGGDMRVHADLCHRFVHKLYAGGYDE